jgi:alkanesulfonate monooxygenase SsuD/methylene tetrahydromethanopterin reductase-like flavin-dependent oxidoreductase (luciferase family)
LTGRDRVDFAGRGRRADEAIDVMRLLWAGDADGVSYDGEFFSIKHLCSFPKPYQTTTLPIHVGGSSRAAARQAGRRGDGYFAGGLRRGNVIGVGVLPAIDRRC